MTNALTGGITVAIACFNQGRFLEQCIRSVLGQILAPDEIILVDDGSTDSTREVAGSFDQVRYIFQRNAGLSAARNTALRAATTRYILFLDADDWLTPVALESAAAAIAAASRSAAFVHGGFHETDESGSVLRTRRATRDPDPFQRLLRGNYIEMHGTVLYDAGLLRASGGFDETLRSCEDYDVFLRLARNHPVSAYEEVAAYYRRHPNSLVRDRFVMIETAVCVIDRHADGTSGRSVEAEAAEAGRRHMTRYYAEQIIKDLRKARQGGQIGPVLRRLISSGVRRPRAALRALGHYMRR
jgi:glycosyltransferase involved in cell wall biosynthesis